MSKMKTEDQEKRNKKWATIGVIDRQSHVLMKKTARSCGIPLNRLIGAYAYMARDASDIDILQADYDYRHKDESESGE